MSPDAPDPIFPDIGLDPLKHRDAVKGGVEGARERLSAAVALQQQGVPDQTALVWRIDLDRVLSDLTWRTCHLEPLKAATAESAKLREELEEAKNLVSERESRLTNIKVLLEPIYGSTNYAPIGGVLDRVLNICDRT